jgi:hypothetical protein
VRAKTGQSVDSGAIAQMYERRPKGRKEIAAKFG